MFEQAWPYYLSLGMPYELFWEADPLLTISYRKAYDLQRRRMNEELWLQGIYFAEALSATVGNMFSKGTKHKYPAEPLPISQDEAEERKQREQKAKMERMKAGFTAKALAMNARLGAKES